MVKRYRAGVAFVEVVPVFGKNQRDIGNMIRDRLRDKSIYEGLERNLDESIERGLRGMPDHLRREFSKSNKIVENDIRKDAEKTGRVSARAIKRTMEKELHGGWWGELINKAGRDVERALGRTTRNMRPGSPFKTLADDINKDVKVLSNALTVNGEKSAREIERTLKNLRARIEKAQKIGVSSTGLTKEQATALKGAHETLMGAHGTRFDQLLEGWTPDELKRRLAEINSIEKLARNESLRNKQAAAAAERQEETRRIAAEKQAARERINVQREEAAAANQIQREADRERARIDAAERKRRILADAEERQLNERQNRDLYRSRLEAGRRDFDTFGKGQARTSMRERRLLSKRDNTVANAKHEMQQLLNVMNQVGSKRIRLKFDSRQSLTDVNHLSSRLQYLASRDFRARIDAETENAEMRLRVLKSGLATLRDVDFDIHLEDATARQRLQAFKAEVNRMRDIDLGVDIPASEVTKLHSRIKVIAESVEKTIKPKVNLDTDGVAGDIATVNAALDSLRDRRVGVDISLAEAMAELSALRAALGRLEDKNVKIDVDIDRHRIDDFMRSLSRTDSDLKRINRSIERSGISISETTQAFRLFSPILTAIVTLGAPVISVLGGITAALGGLVSMAPAVVGSMSAIPFAMAGMGKSLGAYQKAMEGADAASTGAAGGARSLDDAIKRASITAKYQMRDAQRSYANSMADIKDRSAEAAASIKRTFQEAREAAREARKDADEATRSKYADQIADAKDALSRSIAPIRERIEALKADMRARAAEVNARYAEQKKTVQTGADESVRSSEARTTSEVQSIQSRYASRIAAARDAAERERLTKEMNDAIAAAEKAGAERVAKIRKDAADKQKQLEKDRVKAIDDANAAEQKKIDTQLRAIQKLETDHAAKLKRIDRERTQEFEKNKKREVDAIEKASRARARATEDAEADAARQRKAAERQLADARARSRENQAQALEEARLSRSVAGGVSAVSKATSEWNEEMKRLGPEGVAFIMFLDDAQDRMQELQRHARKGFLPGFQSGLEAILDRYQGPFGDFLETSGRQIGNMAKRWGELVTSDSAAAWFARVGADAEKYIGDIGLTIEHIVTGLGHLTDAFRPFAGEFSDWLVNSSRRFRDWADSLQGSAKFERFLDSVRETLPGIGDLLKNVAEFFINASIAVEPFTKAIMDGANSALDFINALDPGVLTLILGGIGGLTFGLMVLAGVMSGIAATSTVITATAGSGIAKAALALGSFIAVNATGIGIMAASSDQMGILGEASDNLGGAFDSISGLGSSVVDFILKLADAVGPLVPVVSSVAADVLTLGTNLANVALTIAGGLLDVLGVVVDLFTALPEPIQESILIIGGGIFVWQKYGDKILDVTKRVTDFSEKILNGVDDLGGFSGALDKGKGSVSGFIGGLSPLTIGLGVAAAAVVGLSIAFDNLNSTAKVETIEDMEKALKRLGKSGTNASAELDHLFSAKDGVFGEHGGIGSLAQFGTMLGENTILINDSASAMKFLGERTSNSLGWFSEFRAEASTMFGLFGKTNMDAVTEQFDLMDDSLKRMSRESFVEASRAFSNLATEAERAGVGQEDLMGYFSGYRSELEATARQLGINDLQEKDYYEWMKGNVPAAVLEAAEAQRVNKDEMAGLADETSRAEDETRELMAAKEELAGLMLSQEEANLAYEEHLLRFNEHMKTAKQTLDDTTKAGQENRREFMAMADATKRKAEADLEATGDGEAYVDTIWNQRESLRKLAERFGMTESEAEVYANTLMGIPAEVNSKAEFRDHASTKVNDVRGKLDELKNPRTAEVKADTSKAKKEIKDFGSWWGRFVDGLASFVVPKPLVDFISDLINPGGKGKKRGRGGIDIMPRATGGLDLVPMASGGFIPNDIAQVVAPNTWRIVGDRMDVDEAFIPLDGSRRSISILMETIRRMPGLTAMANGAVTGASTSNAPAAPNTATPTGVSDAAGAFDAMTANFIMSTDELTASLMGKMTAFMAELSAAVAVWSAEETTRFKAFCLGIRTENEQHLSALASASSIWRQNETMFTSVFFKDSLTPTFTAGQATIRRGWEHHHDAMTWQANGWRDAEARRTNSFLMRTMIGEYERFGDRASSVWSGIWAGLVASAVRIFSRLPGEVAKVLSDVSGKLNVHIVDPYNKIVKDLSLKGDLKIDRFPVQAKAKGGHLAFRDGGTMPGYTPGRDVHRFYSPTGGVLDLSGGEPVLRPEAGVVLGTQWVDGVNAAARSGGVPGVKKFLIDDAMPYQAHAAGGMVWNNLWGLVKQKFPNVRLHSAYRPGSITASGNRSYHSMGKAIDITPSMEIFNWLHDNFGQSSELIFSPAGGRQIKNGKHYMYRGAVRSMHFNHIHWANRSAFGGPTAGAGGAAGDLPGLFDIATAVKGWVDKGAKEVGTGALPQLAIGVAGSLFEQIAKQRKNDFTDHVSPDGGDVPTNVANFIPGKGVGRWRSVVIEALKHVGQSTSETMINTVLRRMNQESGGNPRAINLWDSNARRGTPSKGLMQVIPPTFQAFRDRALGNDIWNPLENIVASMRYALKRYKSLPAAYNRKGGYHLGTAGIDLSDLGVDSLTRDTGGSLPVGYTLIKNGLAHEETIIPETTRDVARLFSRVDEALAEGGTGGVNFYDATFEGSPRDIADEIERISRLARHGAPPKVG